MTRRFFDLFPGRDPGEKADVAKDHPDVLARLNEVIAAHRKGLTPGEPQLEKRLPKE